MAYFEADCGSVEGWSVDQLEADYGSVRGGFWLSCGWTLAQRGKDFGSVGGGLVAQLKAAGGSDGCRLWLR